ncbi:MAG: 50S ribosome-binding GTPase, partial [Thermoplasmata archaeon]|nr:50S ribosome-binding GTPase [Thermoplasmata archaeon]
MGIFAIFNKWLKALFKKKHLRIGIYGPPNAGKTTLANRITRDWLGEEVGVVSEVPHETRHAVEKKEVKIESEGHTVTFDIVDTPGIATKVDFHQFVEDYGMDQEEGKRRAKEATEGVIEAIRWMEDMDGIL